MAVAVDPQKMPSSQAQRQYTRKTVITFAPDESSKSYTFDCPDGIHANFAAVALRVIDFHSCFSSNLRSSSVLFLTIKSDEVGEASIETLCGMTFTGLESKKMSDRGPKVNSAVINFFRPPALKNESEIEINTEKTPCNLDTPITKTLSIQKAKAMLIEPPVHVQYSSTVKGKLHLNQMSVSLKKLTSHPFLTQPAIYHERADSDLAPSILLNTPPQFKLLSLLVLQNYDLRNLTESANAYVNKNMTEFLEIHRSKLSAEEIFELFEKLIDGFVELKRRCYFCHNISFHDLGLELTRMQPYITNTECVTPVPDSYSEIIPLGTLPQTMTSSTETLCPNQSKALETPEQQSIRQLGQIFLLITGQAPKYVSEIIDGQTGIEPCTEHDWDKMKSDAVQAQSQYSVKAAQKGKMKKVLSAASNKIKHRHFSNLQPLQVNLFKLIELMLRGTPSKRPTINQLTEHLAEINAKHNEYQSARIK